jgi:tetratricopeptide (TPR) repeat protein
MGSNKIIAVLGTCLALISCNRDPKVAARRYLESGNQYFAKGRYAEARLMYIKSKQKDLRFGDAYYKWGLTELKLGSYGPAVQAFQRAIELIPPTRPERWDSIVKISDIYLSATHQERDPRNQKQYLDDVERWCNELLKHDPESFDAHRLNGDLNLGKSLMKAQVAEKGAAAQFRDDAIAEYRRADSIKPNQPGVLMQLARTLSTKGDLTGSEQYYRRVIDQDKHAQAAYSELYSLYLFEKKPETGEQLLKAAYQENPKEMNYLTTLALQYSLQKRRADMVNVLEQIKAHAKDFPDAYTVVGDFYYRVGDPDAAIREYREGIARDPKQKVVYEKHTIEVLLQQGKLAEAGELNAQILKQNPKDTDSRGLAASLMLDKGDVAKAITELQSVVTAAPDNPAARFNLGRAYAAKGESEQASHAFEKAIEMKPDYLLARLALAKLQLARGEFEAALKTSQVILSGYDHTNAAAQLVQSACFIGMRKFPEAGKLLDAMARLSPNSPEVALQQGILGLAERKYKDSEEAFAKAYRLNPADARGLVGEVQSYMEDNRGEEGMRLLRAEVDKFPARTDLRVALANTAVDLGKYDEAIGEYQKVLAALAPEAKQRGGVYLRMGEAFRRKGDRASAIANMQKARETQPEDSQTLTNLALTFDEAGQIDKSKQVYEAALKVDPNNGMVLNNLAFQIAEHGGDLNDALTKALKARQLLPNLKEVSDTLGWIYLKKGLNDNAIDIFKDLVDKVPTQATFRYHLGLALYNKGDKSQAARELRESLKYNPSKDERDKIQQLLSQIGV